MPRVGKKKAGEIARRSAVRAKSASGVKLVGEVHRIGSVAE